MVIWSKIKEKFWINFNNKKFLNQLTKGKTRKKVIYELKDKHGLTNKLTLTWLQKPCPISIKKKYQLYRYRWRKQSNAITNSLRNWRIKSELSKKTISGECKLNPNFNNKNSKERPKLHKLCCIACKIKWISTSKKNYTKKWLNFSQRRLMVDPSSQTTKQESLKRCYVNREKSISSTNFSRFNRLKIKSCNLRHRGSNRRSLS